MEQPALEILRGTSTEGVPASTPAGLRGPVPNTLALWTLREFQVPCDQFSFVYDTDVRVPLSSFKTNLVHFSVQTRVVRRHLTR